MPTPEVLSWVLSGALFVITCIGGALYKMLREEAKDHSDRIEKKANNDRLTEIENRLQRETTRYQNDNKELILELKTRHERDIDGLTNRLSEQIRSIESNILSRVDLMIAAMSGRTNLPPN